MARKIRFPLKMKNGAEVRTLEELQANFDLESVLGYFADGKLASWLSAYYYDDMADAVSALSLDTPDLGAKLCAILEISYREENGEPDLAFIQRRNEKIRFLNENTSDREILDQVDLVALNQDDLFDILDEAPEKVYLYGEKFTIPVGVKNVRYIGIGSPLVILDRKKGMESYEKAEISFENVRFEEGFNPYLYKTLEKMLLEGKHAEAFPLLEQAAKRGNPRAMYLMAYYYDHGYGVVKIDKQKRNDWCNKACFLNEPLSLYQYSTWCCEDGSDEQKEIFLRITADVKRMAEAGDVLAQFVFGRMYRFGHGVEQDYAEAVTWYRKAAEQGLAAAQNNLGNMYNNGNGVEQDYAEAVMWYRKAAEQGDAWAQNNLGVIYQNGNGVEQDYAEAVKWYKKAAEQGLDWAQNNLGVMYYNGNGVKQDYAEAVTWYRKAAEQGLDWAQNNLGKMYFNGNGVERDYAEAVRWYRKAAEQGLAMAQCNLGFMYEKGHGVKQDYAEAVRWYRKAAEQGNATAQLILGYMYEMGYGVAKDEDKAIRWYKKSAEQGDKTAKNNLKNLGISID